MSEPAPSKRRWFRFHLLTALILVAEIGALIGLNVTPRSGGIRGWPEQLHLVARWAQRAILVR